MDLEEELEFSNQIPNPDPDLDEQFNQLNWIFLFI